MNGVDGAVTKDNSLLILGRFIFSGSRLFNEFSDVFIRCFKVLPTQVHHMATTVPFEAEAFLHNAARINPPHSILGIEILRGTVIVT